MKTTKMDLEFISWTGQGTVTIECTIGDRVQALSATGYPVRGTVIGFQFKPGNSTPLVNLRMDDGQLVCGVNSGRDLAYIGCYGG